MTKRDPSVQIRVAGHSFRVTCLDEDRPAMQEAVEAVEAMLEDIRGRRRIADSHRGALMAALQIAFDARKAGRAQVPGAEIEATALKICDRIDGALARAKNTLELPAEAGSLDA